MMKTYLEHPTAPFIPGFECNKKRNVYLYISVVAG
jgi:hypothetical protein